MEVPEGCLAQCFTLSEHSSATLYTVVRKSTHQRLAPTMQPCGTDTSTSILSKAEPTSYDLILFPCLSLTAPRGLCVGW